MRTTPKESEIQRAILDYLAAKHILAFRMQVGAVKADTRFFRFGTPGMADVLAFPWYQGTCKCGTLHHQIHPTWIELKTATGKQSELQKSFERQVTEQGHRYIVARSVDGFSVRWPLNRSQGILTRLRGISCDRAIAV